MNIKSNVIANYIGQIYTTLIGIFMLPFYLRYMGAEAYGLVGFFTAMQAWLQLLDLGLSPTLSRQVAHFRGKGTDDYTELLKLLRSIEILFFITGIVIAMVTWFASPWIAGQWLNVKELPLAQVAYCIALMGAMFGLRWFTSLYRSGIQGMEHQVWLNAANALVATARYIGVWALLVWVTQKPEHYFEFQLLVSIVELVVIGGQFYRFLPATKVPFYKFSWDVLKPVIPFTGGVAYTSVIWILLTQLDKLILSHVLSLKEYGYFALVATVTTGIMNFTGPISSAILPRMTLLLSQGKDADMLGLYRRATQYMAVLIFPLAGTVALFSSKLLFAWTGDNAAAEWAGPVLTWFILGNGILAIGAFQYYLQFVYGNLKLHIIISTVNTVLQVPIIVAAAFRYGAIGAGVAWFVFRLLSFFIWSLIVHTRFAPGLHKRWLFEDILPAFLMTSLSLAILSRIGGYVTVTGRYNTLLLLLCVGLVSLFVNMLVIKAPRDILLGIFARRGRVHGS